MTNALLKLKHDNHLYFRKCLKIKDKKARIVPFTINDSQDRLNQIVTDHYTKYPDPDTRPTLYIIILKARQQGMSTFTEGLFFKAITLGLPNDKPFNKVAMIVSYDDDSAKTINDMSGRYLQYLPDVIKPMNRPIRGKGIYFENPSREEFKVKPGLQSKFLIETANNKNAGSGYTINYLHISELAKWQDAETTMTSLLQSVPDYNGIVIVESTAMGVGGYFYDLWMKAKQGKNNYVPLFIPWYEHKEYVTPLAAGEEVKLDQIEEELVQNYNLTPEQVKWRRKTISDKLNGDDEKFKQEYPSNDMEAFLTSGRTRFNTRILTQWLNRAKAGEQGNIEYGQFVPQHDGYITVWKHPEPGRRYVIGADTSEGLATGDYDAATVWDAETWELCARWHGHIDPDVFGEIELPRLGKYYNEALIVPEVNNHGYTTVTALKRVNYPRIYMRERYDGLVDEMTKALGWRTDARTKPLAIDFMAKCIREGLIRVHDEQLINECITYIREADGTTNAQEGCFDDLVMASAIALFVLSNYLSDYFDARDPAGSMYDRQDNLPHALRDDRGHFNSWENY
ncbi:hypothetical protein DNH61_11750 [Paenibacillus sambharensis]|uniref:Terminase large subunit gp17-like C-terminal domain-containing protein n=1 Tax=Paenibacillus sambharensis TaxID=1803190 RepID=A0A2W1LUQ0_9BACL|nr:hypothetical protein [Paenibacillus sambharensis]PZD95227.1 hypothetical protein DNH61_11750 [Paenibacillus sambharensis]